LIEKKQLLPTVYDGKYKGLESVAVAMKDLSARKVWGKAVVSIDVPPMPRL
jgi:NADPH2:quinone reductase